MCALSLTNLYQDSRQVHRVTVFADTALLAGVWYRRQRGQASLKRVSKSYNVVESTLPQEGGRSLK